DYDTDDVSLDRLAIGDRVLVKPGERMPVDGRVLSGSSAVNQAPITGESLPVEKRAGDDVFAGSLNGDGPLVIAATRTAAGSTLAQIERLIEQARSSRAPTERFVDRFARWYTPTVMALAVSVAILPALGVWAGIVEPSVDMTRYLVEWLHRGLVLLVIACPCALVISTPLTITCGLHQATRLGVVVKGGGPLEQLAAIETVAFDKTGTLTSARPQVLAVHAAPGFDQSEVLAAAAGLEAASEHPLAAAVMAEASRRGVSIERADELTIARGAGVVGRWRGKTLTVGSRRFVRESCGVELTDPASTTDASDAMDQPGGPSSAALAGEIVVAEAGRVWGAIQCEDRVRPEAQSALKQLRQLGITPLVMLTGDSWPAARRAAESLELSMADVRAELLPQQKVDEVRRLATDGHVAVALVGDGVNDAPALAAARIGIAFGSGASDTALETADVVVLNNDLQTVPRLVTLARTVRRLLRQNIALALG
ncbi:MAG TPA: cation-translocating P-type ATPase, partial [Pirellulaceae bacterium]|nr:cation-translocating P-type ATPase [Pirellulaceae bacterium]